MAAVLEAQNAESDGSAAKMNLEMNAYAGTSPTTGRRGLYAKHGMSSGDVVVSVPATAVLQNTDIFPSGSWTPDLMKVKLGKGPIPNRRRCSTYTSSPSASLAAGSTRSLARRSKLPRPTTVHTLLTTLVMRMYFGEAPPQILQQHACVRRAECTRECRAGELARFQQNVPAHKQDVCSSHSGHRAQNVCNGTFHS